MRFPKCLPIHYPWDAPNSPLSRQGSSPVSQRRSLRLWMGTWCASDHTDTAEMPAILCLLAPVPVKGKGHIAGQKAHAAPAVNLPSVLCERMKSSKRGKIRTAVRLIKRTEVISNPSFKYHKYKCMYCPHSATFHKKFKNARIYKEPRISGRVLEHGEGLKRFLIKKCPHFQIKIWIFLKISLILKEESIFEMAWCFSLCKQTKL